MKYSVNEVFEMLGPEALSISELKGSRESIDVDGFKVYRKSMRYATFYQKGCKCVNCGKEGSYFQLDVDKDGHSAGYRMHFNLYAEDGTLMTKDHIIPKKWGGRDTIDNLQTMCEDCNKAKGSQYDLWINGIVATKQDNPDKQYQYVDIEKAIYDICNKNHILSRGGKPGTLAKNSIKVAVKIMFALDSNTPAYGYYWRHESFKVKGRPYGEES